MSGSQLSSSPRGILAVVSAGRVNEEKTKSKITCQAL
jgi:hypothetical protein